MAAAPYRHAGDRSQPGGIGSGLAMMAVGLYGASFFLPACGRILGYQAFVWSVIFIVCLPMWLANPMFWVGLACASRGEWRAVRTYGLVALVLSLSEAWMFWGELATGYFVNTDN